MRGPAFPSFTGPHKVRKSSWVKLPSSARGARDVHLWQMTPSRAEWTRVRFSAAQHLNPLVYLRTSLLPEFWQEAGPKGPNAGTPPPYPRQLVGSHSGARTEDRGTFILVVVAARTSSRSISGSPPSYGPWGLALAGLANAGHSAGAAMRSSPERSVVGWWPLLVSLHVVA